MLCSPSTGVAVTVRNRSAEVKRRFIYMFVEESLSTLRMCITVLEERGGPTGSEKRNLDPCILKYIFYSS